MLCMRSLPLSCAGVSSTVCLEYDDIVRSRTVGRWYTYIIARATTDRNSARGGSQVGGRHGGMNDAPLTNKVRVAPPLPPTRYEVLPTCRLPLCLDYISSCVGNIPMYEYHFRVKPKT